MKSLFVFLILMFTVALIAQEKEKSPIPDPPPISMQMIQSVLVEKDNALNSKSLEIAQQSATIEQLKKVILDKDAELKKAQADKKCK